MSDRLVGLVLLLFSGFMYWQTFFFPKSAFAAFQEMGAEFFPRGILMGLGVLALALVVSGKGSLIPGWRPSTVRASLPKYRDVLISLTVYPVYVLAIGLIGFLPSTVVYLAGMQLLLKPRMGVKLLYVVAGSAIFAWAATELFQRYLNVVLPSGSLF